MVEVATSHGKLENILYNFFKGKSTLLDKKNQILPRRIARVFASQANHAYLWRLWFLFNKLTNYEKVTPLKTR